MSKRQARLERAAERQLKDSEKSARLKARPLAEKEVRFGADPNSIFSMTMTWSVDQADRSGQWSSGTPRQWSDATWTQTIEPKLVQWASLTWSEIDRLNTGTGHKMHHSMPTSGLAEEAQNRLIEIERYDDDIFRFRLGGKPRLWGFRVVADFQILWFDPEHEIYPVDVQ